jgi:hypothetical protein
MRAARGAALALVPCALLGCAPLGLGGPRPAWELAPPAAPEMPIVEPGSLQRVALENGLRVLVLEDRRLPRVALGVTFRRGESSVAPERAGLASFTAELMKRGAGGRDALAFAEYVDEIGASFAVSAGWDSLTAGATGLSRDLDRLFAILADAVRAPRFERAEAERARSEQLAAIERAKDDPGTLASWYAAAAVYTRGSRSPTTPSSTPPATSPPTTSWPGRAPRSGTGSPDPCWTSARRPARERPRRARS